MEKSFDERCYKILRKVPKGKVITYKEIARKLGTEAYRAVGNAMHRNHNKKIPCYRVVKSNGEIGGFNRGVKEKIILLRKEGIEIKNNKIDLKNFGWNF